MTMLQKIITVASFLFIVLACNPQTSYKTLSIFFDGVPDPDKPNIADSLAADSLDAQNTENITATKKSVSWIIHDAYSKETCGDCHDKSQAYKILEPLPELCYQCHDDFSEQYEILHAPLEDGECSECHNPHKSKNAALLIAPPKKICFGCHDFEDIKENEAHEDIEPGDCLDCHNPHGGGEFLL
jgi:predicted CXXCH cytochrome family protein